MKTKTHRPARRIHLINNALKGLRESLDQVLLLKNEIESYRAGNKKRSFTEDDAWLISEVEKVIGCFYTPRNKLECMTIIAKK